MRLSESPPLHKQTLIPATSRRQHRRIVGMARCCMLALLLVLSASSAADPSNHYTDKQLDALAARIGKIYWLSSSGGRVPEFFSSAARGAATFQPGPEDSFVIIDLAGRANKDPYYAVRFESGKVGYIRPEAFHEGLNLTILASDPRAEEKEKKEKLNIEEKERVAWIQSQPWSAPVKEAAIRREPLPGLNTGEVKHVLGPPIRITKLRGPSKVDEEQWFYKDGSVMIFRNGLLIKVDKLEKK
jgi:hypothetical protein